MHLTLDIVSIIQKAGYVGIFLCIFLESFPMTFFLPGDSLLFTTGFLASQGYLNFWWLIAIYFVSGTLGYIGSYIFGQKIIARLFTNPNSKIFNPKYITYTKDFFSKYGSKTVIIGRFVPVVRSFAPSLAGMADFTYGKFVRYTIVGVAGWSLCMTTLGYFLGRVLPQASNYITPIIILIIFVSILPTVWDYIKHRREKVR
jgi:membrane-associated protein